MKEINVKELGYNKYLIKPNNYIMDLPLEIVINGKTEKITLTKDGVTVNSSHPPMIDPTGYYLKTVTIQ